MSLLSSQTNSLIFSKRYFCRSLVRPGGCNSGGKSCGDGFQLRCALERTWRLSTSPFVSLLTNTLPGVFESKTRW